MVMIALAYAVKQLKLDFIELTFLVSGHSQNENDTAHSTIETGYRRKTIFTTDQWESTIRNAFIKNVCKIETLMFDDIIDYKNPGGFPEYADVLKDKCVDISSTSTSTGQKHGNNGKTKAKKPNKIMWKSLVQVKFAKHDRAYFKYDYEEDYREMAFANKIPSTRKTSKKKGVNCKKYEKPIGINPAKKGDLLKMCKKGSIQSPITDFTNV